MEEHHEIEDRHEVEDDADVDSEEDPVELEAREERLIAFREKRENCYNHIINAICREFPDVEIQYGEDPPTYKFYSLHLEATPFLFSLIRNEVLGWVYISIGDSNSSRRLPRRTAYYNMQQAKSFVDRVWRFLRKYPLTAMHLALSEMKKEYETPLRAIAAKRGVEAAPDVMMFMLFEEECVDE